MAEERIPGPNQIRVMEANEKKPVAGGPCRMDVLPEVYLWYHTPADTDVLAIRSFANMHL